MSRTSRIPYHQNVYDLLQLEPGESPEAARMIAEHEAQHGPLPASVREWYLVPNVVMLEPRPAVWLHQWELNKGKLWWEYSNQDPPTPLPNVLEEFTRLPARSSFPYVCVLTENQGVVRWWLEVNGTDDPPVWVDNDQPDDVTAWSRTADCFSDFVSDRASRFYDWQCNPKRLWLNPARAGRPHANRLWLRSRNEPFQPPVIDFLLDQFCEPERTPRAGNVTTYAFHPPGGTIRVTADEPALTGGLSAWWVHAETGEQLAEFARLLRPWGTLRDTLRADTDPAREVLQRIRGA